jgi:hypothetical protein
MALAPPRLDGVDRIASLSIVGQTPYPTGALPSASRQLSFDSPTEPSRATRRPSRSRGA